eukprot:scaffold149_cov383-Prasinococcus_capsulatus_cf.AAC.19
MTCPRTSGDTLNSQRKPSSISLRTFARSASNMALIWRRLSKPICRSSCASSTMHARRVFCCLSEWTSTRMACACSSAAAPQGAGAVARCDTSFGAHILAAGPLGEVDPRSWVECAGGTGCSALGAVPGPSVEPLCRLSSPRRPPLGRARGARGIRLSLSAPTGAQGKASRGTCAPTGSPARGHRPLSPHRHCAPGSARGGRGMPEISRRRRPLAQSEPHTPLSGGGQGAPHVVTSLPVAACLKPLAPEARTTARLSR